MNVQLDDAPEDEVTVLWRVTPDYGEKDFNVVLRENDVKNGEKFSGWTNPLSWTDNGADDDQVLLHMRETEDSFDALSNRGLSESGWITPADNGLDDDRVVNFVQYDESEGPTKADNGELDEVVVYRESDIKNGEKFSGWTNPLSWTDDGASDDTVLAQYDESEGPTKADNGELDEVVVYRESDVKNGEKFSGWTNPLSWTDDGTADDTVV